MDIIHKIANLPEAIMCETIKNIDLTTLERFDAYYGIDPDDEDDDLCSGDLLPFSAHVAIAARLRPEPAAPAPTFLLPGPSKIDLIALRFQRGRALRSPRDVSHDQLGDGVGRDTTWHRQDVLRLRDLTTHGEVTPGQAKVLKMVRRAEVAA